MQGSLLFLLVIGPGPGLISASQTSALCSWCIYRFRRPTPNLWMRISFLQTPRWFCDQESLENTEADDSESGSHTCRERLRKLSCEKRRAVGAGSQTGNHEYCPELQGHQVSQFAWNWEDSWHMGLSVLKLEQFQENPVSIIKPHPFLPHDPSILKLCASSNIIQLPWVLEGKPAEQSIAC